MINHVASAGNLPPELTSFVGRRRDICEAKELLSRTRILTLIGPGGVGKTRLAVRTASKVSRSYPDGVWLVELAALPDGDRVARTVAASLGVPIDEESEPRAVLEAHLRGKRMLVVLDTCEHLIEECAQLADRLLRVAPRLHILTTSRQPLGVEGEHVMPVTPLSLPDTHSPSSPGTPAQSEAVRLFVERAAAVLPGFTLSDVNSEILADICRRLDGLPLSIELAATRLRVLSVGRLLQRVQDPLGFLTGGARYGPARQQTLRATIDWSYRLCSPAEQLLWSRLSVFAEGAELEAAEAVCSGGGIAPNDVLDLLAGLMDKSILVKEETGGQVRFRMHHAIRQYGLERLDNMGEEAVLRRRHLAWCLEMAERADAEWFGPDQQYWSGQLSREEANLRAAVAFGAQEPSLTPAALRIAAGAWPASGSRT
ncbi:AAA family ATPase [Streptomyces sp. NPDC007205]|uniref:ATP-binding protein n=1 Tax=Streptomyces sp. NPDC007205 TaxID=3154316 RepID=UPI00340496D7